MEDEARANLGPYLNLPANKVEPTRGGGRGE
jgi:hypothetical protein